MLVYNLYIFFAVNPSRQCDNYLKCLLILVSHHQNSLLSFVGIWRHFYRPSDICEKRLTFVKNIRRHILEKSH